MVVGTTCVCMLGLGSDLFHCLHTNDVVRSIPVDEVSRFLKAVLQAVCSPIVATQWDSLAVSPPKLHPTCNNSQTVDHRHYAYALSRGLCPSANLISA